VYGKQGIAALEAWLKDEGVKNIEAVNDSLKGAKPWYSFYGAKSAEELAV
jgi:tagatose 1,6-diphosphate aldolase